MRNLTKFSDDRRGATTTEFLIILPLIFFWFAASFVFFDVFTVSTASKRATYTVADIMSRQSAVDDAFIGKLGAVYQAMAGQTPSSGDTALRISTIRQQSGVKKVIWSSAYGKWDGVVHTGGKVDGPSADIIKGYVPDLVDEEEMVMVETRRAYKPLFDWVGISERDLTTVSVVYIRGPPLVTNSDQPEVVVIESNSDEVEVVNPDGTQVLGSDSNDAPGNSSDTPAN